MSTKCVYLGSSIACSERLNYIFFVILFRQKWFKIFCQFSQIMIFTSIFQFFFTLKVMITWRVSGAPRMTSSEVVSLFCCLSNSCVNPHIEAKPIEDLRRWQYYTININYHSSIMWKDILLWAVQEDVGLIPLVIFWTVQKERHRRAFERVEDKFNRIREK